MIMKIIISGLLLLFSSSFICAQRHYMSISFGATNPRGQYAESEDLTSNGFARRGFLADYHGAYYLNRYFGFNGNFTFGSNQVNAGAARELLEETIPRGISATGDQISMNAGTWFTVSLLAGPQVTLPMGNLFIDLNANGGVAFILPPKLEIIAVDNKDSYIRAIRGQDLSFAWKAGSALRYNLNRQTGIRMAFSYYFSAVQTLIREEVTVGSDNIDITESDLELDLQNMNISFGLIYRL